MMHSEPRLQFHGKHRTFAGTNRTAMTYKLVLFDLDGTLLST